MPGIMLAFVAMAVPCITAIVLMAMVLRFATKMVDMNHGDTKCLRDIAVMLRALRSVPSGLLVTLTRMINRR